MSRVALVSGGNKGIGFEIVRQLAARGFEVVLGCRDLTAGNAAAARIEEPGRVAVCQLDVTDTGSIERATRLVESRYQRLDVLVNNAGVALDKFRSALDLELATLRETLEVNVIGAFALTRAMAPLLLRADDARVINLSSTLGSLDGMGGLTLAYRMSKTALNAMTRVLAGELGGHGVAVNSMCPGWVRTALGGADAERSPEEGADTAVWLATVDPSPRGGFWKDREPVPW